MLVSFPFWRNSFNQVVGKIGIIRSESFYNAPVANSILNEASSFDGINGIEIQGASVSNPGLGRVISNVGDINGDGISDMLIGYSNQNISGNVNAGRAFVVMGHTGIGADAELCLAIQSRFVYRIDGVESGGYFGSVVDIGGDLNGDGFSDMVFGAEGANSQKGRVHVIYGGNYLNQ